jgi:hypothetical protein
VITIFSETSGNQSEQDLEKVTAKRRDTLKVWARAVVKTNQKRNFSSTSDTTDILRILCRDDVQEHDTRADNIICEIQNSNMLTTRSLYSAFDLMTINNEDRMRVRDVEFGVALEHKHFYKFRKSLRLMKIKY